MPGRVRRSTLMLALLLAATTGASKGGFGAEASTVASNVDCWLLEGSDLDHARDQGLCQDAFSRNSRAGEPPVVTAPAAPIPGRKPTPPEKPVRTVSRSAKAKTTVQASQVVRPARTASAEGGTDFGTQFRRDWNSLMRALGAGGASTGTAGNGSTTSTPAHMSRNGH